MTRPHAIGIFLLAIGLGLVVYKVVGAPPATERVIAPLTRSTNFRAPSAQGRLMHRWGSASDRAADTVIVQPGHAEPNEAAEMPAPAAPDAAPDDLTGTEATTDQTAPPSREFLRAAITQFITQHMGDRKLSSGQLESLIDAMTRARDGYEELNGLEDTPGNARHIAEVRARIGRAHADEYEIVGEPLALAGPFAAADVQGEEEP